MCKLHITNFDSEIRKVTLVASKCSAMPRVRPSWRAWRTPSLVKGMVRPGGGENPAEPTAYRRLLAWDHPLWTTVDSASAVPSRLSHRITVTIDNVRGNALARQRLRSGKAPRSSFVHPSVGRTAGECLPKSYLWGTLRASFPRPLRRSP